MRILKHFNRLALCVALVMSPISQFAQAQTWKRVWTPPTAAENGGCSPTGSIATDSAGKILSCQGGAWKSSGAGLGVGQTWRAYATPSERAANILYANSTANPIVVSYSTNQEVSIYVNGINIITGSGYNTASPVYTFIVPVGHSYKINCDACVTYNYYPAAYKWAELR